MYLSKLRNAILGIIYLVHLLTLTGVELIANSAGALRPVPRFFARSACEEARHWAKPFIRLLQTADILHPNH